jgi:hypothetical protein
MVLMGDISILLALSIDFVELFSTLLTLMVSPIKQVKRLLHEQGKKRVAGSHGPFLLRADGTGLARLQRAGYCAMNAMRCVVGLLKGVIKAKCA